MTECRVTESWAEPPRSSRRELSIALGELEAFVQVVDSGGFTSAARRLHLSQPGLSSRIIKLERKLGAVLIDRSSRRLTLTPAGRTLLPRVRTLLGQMDEAVAALDSRARLHPIAQVSPLEPERRLGRPTASPGRAQA
jgi:DNA-binding transcriptional LysR family regulator